jgi:DNA-binding transcriptional regulator/RsmH inhibitor MraZ
MRSKTAAPHRHSDGTWPPAPSLSRSTNRGRITLEDKARRHAGLDNGTQVMIVGNLTTLELWRPSRYRTIEAEDELASGPRVWDDHDGGER